MASADLHPTAHDHDHDHDHEATPPPDEGWGGYGPELETAVRELLIEKGLITADAVRRTVEAIESTTPAVGGRLVARAWVDPAFRARLLADGSAAARELGVDMGTTRLLVVENTPDEHNLIVCTLCSCYPRAVLGLPPAWYKSFAYRSRAVREPRAVLAEFGTVLPEGVSVRVHDSTADMRYMVLPLRPAGTEGWSEEALAALPTRDSMIGVTDLRGALALAGTKDEGEDKSRTGR
ncbi:MAG: nitrile hydratase subunit alpha [Armatimonadetes bacterium]|nr:nitrile hydratase subunit alpha [Armatimonadota bacterium]